MNVLSLPPEAAPEALDGAASGFYPPFGSIIIRAGLIALVLLCFNRVALAAATTRPATTQSACIDPRFHVIAELLRDDFDRGLANWVVESQQPGRIQARDGALDIDVAAGCTVWLKTPLDGPLMIEYEAIVIARGGANDRVSDLNCFWMARDARSPEDLFATRRSGRFEEYNFLRGYYVGLGGNGNTTSRFRRYVGDATTRPLLPEHDLRDKRDLLAANVPQTIRLVACDKLIEYWRDDRRMFETIDDAPYTRGHFAFRTVQNHMQIRRFRVCRIAADLPATTRSTP